MYVHGIKWKNNDNLKHQQINCVGFDNPIFLKDLHNENWLENFVSQVTITGLTDGGWSSFEKLMKSFITTNHCETHLHINNLSFSLESIYFSRNWYVNCGKS